jgi:hypothetical protein
LGALALLPVLWWLLRATPPAPRAQSFPAIRLLAGLRPREETPARTPWWLLALRLAASALVILGLAQPVLTGRRMAVTGTGPALLVIDDGWAAGPDFPARLAAAGAILDRLDRAGRSVQLLTTAPGEDGRPPRLTAAMPAALLRPILDALHPKPWPTGRAMAAAAITGSGPVFYLSDGLAGPGDASFAKALAGRGHVSLLSGDLPVRLLGASVVNDGLVAQLRQTPARNARQEFVLAEASDGGVLARVKLSVPAGATVARATLALPADVLHRLAALRLAGVAGAGAVALLDEAARLRPVGLVSSGTGADTPLLGDQFFLDRALAPITELRHGTVSTLLGRDLSMLVLTSPTLSAADQASLVAWVRQGGLLLRFAGAGLAPLPDPAEAAQAADPLLPGRLLAGDRQLSGAMSWGQPAHLAPFPDGSPFAGLRVPAEVTVARQVLADPAASPAPATWASLADGTPLVTATHLGAGEVVLFHVTANADWSNLPLSGLFVDMLSRVVARSAGVAVADDGRRLAPALALDGAGVLGAMPPFARALAARDIAHTVVSPAHPPGFYGSKQDRHALNLGAGLPAPAAIVPVPGADLLSLAAAPREVPLGPGLIAFAVLLLVADMILTLRLRGLLDGVLRFGTAVLVAAAVAGSAHADSPALATHLAYVVTGDAQVDATSKAGLAGLSDYVNSRTAAVLGEPIGVTPGRDALGYYPLLYFPVTAAAENTPAFVTALNDYMRHGGIVVIDLRGGDAESAGSGAGAAPDTAAALRRIGQGLDIPRLAPLTSAHVLARAFYLLQDFPGRFDGDTVWVQQDQDRSNDSVSPVIVGANDWAAAWAQDEDGNPLFATVPGGPRQRTLAFRFGVNLVMYALTGNYKGDQVHVPAILERLGQ